MWQMSEQEVQEEELLAGRKVAPGIYRELNTHREVRLEQEDFLPASLDGRVACYVRVASLKLSAEAELLPH
jgi:hypothetical protein